MCEFCTAHGEGHKWYLQMKNYADELLYQELSDHQQAIVGRKTRFEWNNDFIQHFVMPAVGGLSMPALETAPDSEEPSPAEIVNRAQPDMAEIMARRKVEHYGQVLPIEDVEQVIELADSITRMPCGCRYINTGLTDKRYCFGLGFDKYGILGSYPDASASLEVLDKKEARQIFHRFDEDGLIHSVWTGVTPYVIGLCNCDRDCGAYKGYIELRGAPHFFRAEYICQVDWDQCDGCKSCLSQCQFGAQFYSHAQGKVYIDPTRCFGCGVCRAACPQAAIELLPRQECVQAADLW